MHPEDLPVFRLVRMRARSRPGSITDYKDVLLDLYATDAEYSADALEGIYRNLEEVSSKVLQEEFTDQDAAATLSTIAQGRRFEWTYPAYDDGYTSGRSAF